jgi:hypothetical protein
VINRSAEPDGSFRRYILPVDSELRPIPDPAEEGVDFGDSQTLTALNAVASWQKIPTAMVKAAGSDGGANGVPPN